MIDKEVLRRYFAVRCFQPYKEVIVHKWLFLVPVGAIGGLLWYIFDRLEDGENVSWPHLLVIVLCLALVGVWGFLANKRLTAARHEIEIFEDLVTQDGVDSGLKKIVNDIRTSELEFGAIERPDVTHTKAYRAFLESRGAATNRLIGDRRRFARAIPFVSNRLKLRAYEDYQHYLESHPSDRGRKPAA